MSCKLFLSWAHADEALKESLVTLLVPHLSSLVGIRFDWWEDSQLRVGEPWRRDILARLGESDYALQLLSPGFFASDFIVTEELPPFVADPPVKACLPVALRPFSINAETHGLRDLQMFLSNGKCFSELDRRGKDRFALALAEKIRQRLVDENQWRAL